MALVLDSAALQANCCEMDPSPEKPGVSATRTPLPSQRAQGLLSALLVDASPIDLRLVGRTLLHAALVGVGAGVVAVVFFAAIELLDRFFLSGLAGYRALRAAGESFLGEHGMGAFRPWLLMILPALGGLASGLLTRLAPECRGGGGDAMIEAFHRHGGIIRRRVVWVKALASALTLGTGGAGGREGPTMQIGAAFGSFVAGTLKVSARERRLLMIAGVAAGMSAIFRTPLGAALLATEVLYRDDVESDALIPALLASVLSYSVFISVFGEATLFAHAPRYPFVPAHLPLYALLAIFVALCAIVFLKVMAFVKRTSARLPVPDWARPGVGGLALGLVAVPLLLFLSGRHLVPEGQGIGVLGGGYGAAQVAITGASWLPDGWQAVELLVALAAIKIVAASLTIGTGGSAGDFAPSLAIGGLVGGAFGRIAALSIGDPRIDPGAFALVGMGTFYGGVAHVPLGSLVMVCELAGSYDLLVPLMLAEGIAFVALRDRSLYSAQVPTQRDSPAHPPGVLDVLGSLKVADVMIAGRPYVQFALATPVPEVLRLASDTGWQDVFPVLDGQGKMAGVITSDVVRLLATERDLEPFALAADAMQPPVTVRPDDDLRKATEVLLAQGVREVPVVDDAGRIVGFLDESEVGRAYLDATAREERAA
ncbi:chloride channel protein [Polyangium mundeleinium]|uniref:Chloride channel protein n=1 Tax=Polyangium mundeleinium TaxID=2995306 RepID=A0ABT5EI56_9BACT|nr:chloride channel protein [Polyangium mundeleinium]MDC0740440.1 chloride channel protein [Polyangium mundeleinium]